MINTFVLIAFSVFIILCFGFRPENNTLALVTKIVQEVAKKSATAEWAKATNGDMLIAGDQVRTGKQSLAVIKFIDRSIIRVCEQSELTVTSSGQNGGTVKIIQLSKGSFGFDVKKQQNDRFRGLPRISAVIDVVSHFQGIVHPNFLNKFNRHQRPLSQ